MKQTGKNKTKGKALKGEKEGKHEKEIHQRNPLRSNDNEPSGRLRIIRRRQQHSNC